jgi:DNA-binding protein YbaB
MSDNAGRPSPEQMLEQLAQMQRDAEATLRKYDELSAEFGADAVEVFSDDGLLRVKLDGNGAVDEIEVNEAAMRFRQSLGPSMVALIAQARSEYALKSAEMARRMLGGRIDVDSILSQYLPREGRDERPGQP